MMQMGYMHDGPGQYMMPHGQQNNVQLPSSGEGVPLMMGGAINENQGQMPNVMNMGQGQSVN